MSAPTVTVEAYPPTKAIEKKSKPGKKSTSVVVEELLLGKITDLDEQNKNLCSKIETLEKRLKDTQGALRLANEERNKLLAEQKKFCLAIEDLTVKNAGLKRAYSDLKSSVDKKITNDFLDLL